MEKSSGFKVLRIQKRLTDALIEKKAMNRKIKVLVALYSVLRSSRIEKVMVTKAVPKVAIR